MRKEIFWAIAFSMIFLIVTIPFYVADAYGQGQDVSTIGRIVYPTPTGINNASGFIMSSDTLTILVNLRAKTLPAAQVANNVFVEMGGARYNFTSCSDLGSSWYDCAFQKPLVNMPGGSYQGKIVLDAPECAACEVPLLLGVDAMPPTFSQFTISPLKTNQQNITVSYSGNDKICPSCAGTCSGIKNILIYPSNDYSKILANIFVNQSPNAPSNCAEARTLNNVSISALPSGNYSICIAGLDNAGNINLVNATCSNLIVAKEPPSIETPVIRDAGGELLTFVSGNVLLARISTVITSPYAELTKATVDLSAFQLGTEELNCLRINESRRWNCTKQFNLLLSPSLATQTIPITVYDDAGNVKKQNFVYGLKVDASAPTLASFRTNYVYGNFSFFGPKENRIYLTFNELQSGFSKNFTYAIGLENYFDVLSGAGLTKYQAECQQSGTKWECAWPAVDLKTSVPEMAVLGFEVSDDMGNRLEIGKEVIIDNKPPVIVDVEIHTENNYAALGVGQNIVLRANITENSAMVSKDYNIYADLTKIEGGSVMRKADSCELINETYIQGTIYNGSNWICSWVIRNIKEFGDWKPIINATDITGNQKMYYEYPALYLAYINPATGNLSYQKVDSFASYPMETNVSDYWKVESGIASPSALDRQMLPVIASYVYVPLVFTPLTGGPQIVQVTLEGCANDGTASEINLFPNIPNASNMEFRVVNGDYGKMESLRYACQIGIVSIANNMLTQKEVDNVTIGVDLFELPLGKFDKSVKDKVKEVYERISGPFSKTLGYLNTALDWSKWLCGIFNFIINIGKMFSEFVAIAQAAFEVCKLIPIIGAVCIPPSEDLKLGEMTESMAESSFGVIGQKFCNFVLCTMGEGTSLGNWQSQYAKIRERMTPNVADFFKKQGTVDETTSGGGDANGGGEPADTATAATRFITGFAETETTDGSNTDQPKSKSTSERKQKAIDTLAVLSDKTVEFWPADLSQSLVLSMVFLCIPGIVYNLEKYRQILCNYGMCVIQTAQSGGPLKGCEEMKKMQTCIAVTGEIFAVLPYSKTFGNIEGYLQSVFYDPTTVILFATATFICPTKLDGLAMALCNLQNKVTNGLEWITKTMGLYQDLANKIEAGKDAFASQNICDSFIKAYEDQVK